MGSGDEARRLADLADVFEACPDSIFVTDGSGKVIMVNKASKTMTGTGAKEVIGKNVVDLEAQGVFSPSVTRMTLEDGRPHTVLQAVANGKYILATSNPLKKNGRIVKVVTSSRDVSALVNEACQAGVSGVEIERLRAELERARVVAANLRREVMKLKGYEGESFSLVSRSPVMGQITELAATIADVDSTVLITGESGVGKEVLARYIHHVGGRARHPFVKVCCGAIPESLLESELFGYAAGSFTGAKREGKVGLIEAADKGTVFLDEIGDLPGSVQVKLLHVLQEKKVMRIGRVDQIPVDVRFIAATNADLESLVNNGTFRRDLYYRLNVIPIRVPSLRERADDIPLLAQHFLNRLNARYGKQKILSAEIVSVLQEYDWPGNVRELENLIERFVVTVKDDEIVCDHLPPHMTRLRGAVCNPASGAVGEAVRVTRVVPLKQALDDVESQLVKMALREQGSMRAAARALGVNVSTVSRKATRPT